MTVQLAGSLAESPEDDFDPHAIAYSLTRSAHGALRFAPSGATSRLVWLLSSKHHLFAMFDRVAKGESLQDIADEHDVPYTAVVAIFGSDDPAITAMRKVIRSALAMQDRYQARTVLRDAATRGGLEDDQKRLIDAAVGLSKAEDPAPSTSHTTKVQVGVSLGDALVAHHKQTRKAVTYEHEGVDELGI